MPRRRPSALRGEFAVRVSGRRRYPSIDYLPGSCAAAVCRLERTRFPPGSTAEAFWHWKALANGPLRDMAGPFVLGRCGVPECCDPGYFRDHLEAVLHALPRKSARELGALVRQLDDRILTRAKVLGADAPDTPWWRGRL